jgi:diguanylate cyclase (GGDEF)-like protein
MTETGGSLPQPADIQILVVDDNYSVLEVVDEILTRAGFQVTTATTGADAMRLLRERAFHVLLADLRMSPVSGWEVIRQAKEFGETEVIVMTGYANLDSWLEALHQRVFDFLQKPLDFERLQRAVKNAANQSILTRKNRQLVEQLEIRNRELEQEIQKARAEPAAALLRDPATGLYPESHLREILPAEAARCQRYHHPLSLAFLELEGLPVLVRQQGAEAAERVLAQAAQLFTQNIRGCDSLFRTDEGPFAILFPETSQAQARVALDRLAKALNAREIPAGGGTILRCIAGLASLPDDASAGDPLMKATHEALRAARERGGGAVVLASALPFR